MAGSGSGSGGYGWSEHRYIQECPDCLVVHENQKPDEPRCPECKEKKESNA
jgi:hypothetical protein